MTDNCPAMAVFPPARPFGRSGLIIFSFSPSFLRPANGFGTRSLISSLAGIVFHDSEADNGGVTMTGKACYSSSAQEEGVMSSGKKPLKPDDFPVSADGKKIKKQDGTPIANTDDPAVADDVAERLNEDEARREEDKWSA